MPEVTESIIEKVDALSEQAIKKSEEVTEAKLSEFKETLDKAVEEKSSELKEQAEALAKENEILKEKQDAFEAQLKEMKSASIHLNKAKSVFEDTANRVVEQVQEVAKNRSTKEIKVFEDHNEYNEIIREQKKKMQEASFASTYNSAGLGGHTNFLPIQNLPRFSENPLRKIADVSAQGNSAVQYHVNDSDYSWVYGDASGGAERSGLLQEKSWTKNWVKMTSNFSVLEDVLSDINGLQQAFLTDLIASCGRVEALGMIYNDDSSSNPANQVTSPADANLVVGTTPTNVTRTPQISGTNQLYQALGGQFGFEGLCVQHQTTTTFGAGTLTNGSYNSSPTNVGVDVVRTLAQNTENNDANADNFTYQDLVKLVYSLPMQYRANAVFMGSPEMLAKLRSLVSEGGSVSVGTPTNALGAYAETPLISDAVTSMGYLPTIMGRPFIENPFMPAYQNTSGTAGASGVQQIPLIYGDFMKAYKIVDRADLTIRLYDQHQVDRLTFFAKKRASGSVVDPNAIVRLKVKEDANLANMLVTS